MFFLNQLYTITKDEFMIIFILIERFLKFTFKLRKHHFYRIVFWRIRWYIHWLIITFFNKIYV